MLEAGIASVFWVRQPRMANGAWDGAAALLRYYSLLLSSFGFKHDLASMCSKRRFGSGMSSNMSNLRAILLLVTTREAITR